MKIGGRNGNYGAIMVTMGAVSTPVPYSCYKSIIFFPCNITDYNLLPLKPEFSRKNMTSLLSTKFDLEVESF